MATVANIFTLKLENKDFNAQLQTAAKTSQDYNNKIANNLLEAARHQTTLINLTKAKSEAQLAGDKESIKSLNQQIAATKSLIQVENQKISQSKMGIASQLEEGRKLIALDGEEVRSKNSLVTAIQRRNDVLSSLASQRLSEEKARYQTLSSLAAQKTREIAEEEISNAKRRNDVLSSLASQRLSEEKARYQTLSSLAAQKTREAGEPDRLRSGFESTYANTSAQNKFNASLAELNSLKSQGIISEVEYSKAIKKTNEALKNGAPERDNQFNHMIRMMGWAGTLAGAYYALSTAWNATIGKGIELGRQIEDMGMGISALTAANTSNISSNGAILTSMDKFRLSTVMTIDTMKQLRKAAIDTPASFSEMATIFQQAYVSTSKMGQGFGLTVTDITKNTVQLATRMANIAGAIGMPMQKALEETRSLMSGQASGDSLIASLLFGSPAQANEAMRKAQEAGPLGVKKMLDGVMESFDVLAGVDTYSKSLAQAKGAYENLITKMAEPVKNDLSNMFKAIAKNFDETTVAGKRNIKELEDGFKGVYGSITTILKGVALLAKPITATLSLSGSGWVLLAKLFDEKVTNVAIDNQRTRYTPITSQGQAERIEKGILPKQREALSNIQAQIRSNQLKADAIYEGRITGTTAERLKDKNGVEIYEGRITGTTAERLKLNREIVNLRAQENAYIKNINGLQYIGLQYKEKNAQITKDTLATSTRNTDLEVANIKFNEAHVTNTTKLNKLITDNRKNLKEQLAEEAKLLANPDSKLKQLELLKVRAAIAETTKTIAHAEQDIAKEGDKATSKAETEANKENRRQLSAMEKMQQRHQTEMANALLEEAASVANFNLDQSHLTAIERLKLRQLDNEAEGLGNELTATNSISDVTLRTFEQNQKIEQILKNRTEYATTLVALEQKQTAEQEKQALLSDKWAAKEFENDAKLADLQMKRNRETPSFERTFGMSKISKGTADTESQWRRDIFALDMQDVSPLSDTFKIEEIKLNQMIERIKAQIVEIPPIDLKINLQGWDDFSNGMAGIITTVDGLNNATEKYNETLKVLEEQRSDTALNDKERMEIDKSIANLKANNSQDQLSSYASLTHAVSMFAKVGSKEQKALLQVERGVHVAKMAMSVQAMVMDEAMTAKQVVGAGMRATADGIAAIAKTLASLPFPYNLAAGAAVAAVLVGTGVKLFGSGGSGSGTAPTYTTTTGTVLGDVSASSESITKLTDLMSSIHVSEYSELRDINRAVTSMAQGIESAVTNIFKGGALDTSGINLQSTISSTDKLVNNLNSFTKSLNVSGISFIDKLTDLGGNIFGKVLGGLFGGGTEQSIYGSGLTVSGGTLGNKASGNIGASTFVDIKTTTDGGWFSSDKESYSSLITALDTASAQSISLIYKSFQDTMLAVNDGLGSNLAPAITNYTMDAIRLNLQGKTGEESVKALNDAFSAMGDKMASDVFGPVINQYQKLGEGLLETAVRVITEKEVILQDLGDIGQTVNGDLIGITQNLVTLSGSLGDFQDSVSAYYDKYFTDEEKLTRSRVKLSLIFTDLGYALPPTTLAFRNLVDSLDLSTASGQETFTALMGVSGVFSDVAEGVSKALDNIIKDAQSLSDAFMSMSTSIQDTISKLLSTGSSSSQATMIGSFWEKRAQADALLAKRGDLTVKEQQTLQGLVTDLDNLALSIQGAQVGSTGGITSSLVGQLQDLKGSVDLDNAIVQSRILDANGQVTNVATEGTLTRLANAMADRNALLGIDGSHAGGLDYVPYDGYIAQLHKGERVLTAAESNGFGGRTLVNFDTSALEAINNKIYDRINAMYNILNDAQIGSRPLYVRS